MPTTPTSATGHDRVGYRVEVKRDLCIGAGTCVLEAPRVFDLDDEDIAIIIDPNGGPDDDVLAAAEGCPTEAIELFDATGVKAYPR